MTARLGPVEDPSPEQAELLAPYRTFSGGEPYNIFRTLARHPKLFKRSMVLATGLLVKGNLPPRVREIAILRVAWRAGSNVRSETRWASVRSLARSTIYWSRDWFSTDE